jgi:hypothetical protein
LATQEDSPQAVRTDGPVQGVTPHRLTRWLRRELVIAGILIPVGVLLLPIAIYFTGHALLGQYSDQGDGIGRLYADIFRDVGSGSPWAIALVLSPWLGLQILRLAWHPLSRRSTLAEAGQVQQDQNVTAVTTKM